MDEPTISRRRDLRYRALADPTRRRILRLLDDSGGDLDATALATAVDLHVNTVRGHLDLLLEAGLVERVHEERERPGRPRVLYRARPPDERDPSAEGYRFLAEVLASSIQSMSPHPDLLAEQAGRAWGRYLIERPAPFHHASPGEVVEAIVGTLADLGFEPDLVDREGAAEVHLHDCPFREVARSRGTVVCSVHLGMMRGMVEELGGEVDVESLEPFVEPSLCIARLRTQEEEREER